MIIRWYLWDLGAILPKKANSVLYNLMPMETTDTKMLA